MPDPPDPVRDTRIGRIHVAIGSPTSVRLIFAAMVLYALIIGGLMFGYARVQKCLSDYTNTAAIASKARAEAFGEDRQINIREAALNDSDRDRLRIDQKAMLDLLRVTANPTATEAEKRKEFEQLIETQSATADILARNEQARKQIIQDRAATDEKRRRNPIPEPPSEIC